MNSMLFKEFEEVHLLDDVLSSTIKHDRLEMTEILLKGRKTLTHPSIKHALL